MFFFHVGQSIGSKITSKITARTDVSEIGSLVARRSQFPPASNRVTRKVGRTRSCEDRNFMISFSSTFNFDA